MVPQTASIARQQAGGLRPADLGHRDPCVAAGGLPNEGDACAIRRDGGLLRVGHEQHGGAAETRDLPDGPASLAIGVERHGAPIRKPGRVQVGRAVVRQLQRLPSVDVGDPDVGPARPAGREGHEAPVARQGGVAFPARVAGELPRDERRRPWLGAVEAPEKPGRGHDRRREPDTAAQAKEEPATPPRRLQWRAFSARVASTTAGVEGPRGRERLQGEGQVPRRLEALLQRLRETAQHHAVQ